jgi:hypothetical protein
MPDTLSPAAQAVLDALLQAKFGKEATTLHFPKMAVILGRYLAAALRAAAYQVVPNDELAAPVWTEREEVRAALLAIADELEAQP